jgi:hypothetical protein
MEDGRVSSDFHSAGTREFGTHRRIWRKEIRAASIGTWRLAAVRSNISPGNWTPTPQT